MPDSTAATDLSNHFLLAMPGMADPNFAGALVLVVEHNDKGALGLVVNKPTTMSLPTLLSRIELDVVPGIERGVVAPAAIQVFYGGPVQTDRGFVLHQPSGQWNSTVAIGDHISLTTSKDVLEAVAAGRGPERLLVTLGYAGWGPGQLEDEMLKNGWLTGEGAEELIFGEDHDAKWPLALKAQGIDPSLLSGAAGRA